MTFISARQEFTVKRIYKFAPANYVFRTLATSVILFVYILLLISHNANFTEAPNLLLIVNYTLCFVKLNNVIQGIFFQWILSRQTVSKSVDYTEIRSQFVFPLFCVSDSFAQLLCPCSLFHLLHTDNGLVYNVYKYRERRVKHEAQERKREKAS